MLKIITVIQIKIWSKYADGEMGRKEKCLKSLQQKR